MKLKTLKDLEISCSEEDYPYATGKIPKECATIFKEELRKEAIKWIKDGELALWDLDQWIKHFFNITEEDLK